MGKIVSIIYDAQHSFGLKPGEFLNLRAIEQECVGKGIVCKTNKSHIIVELESINFQVFSNGHVGLAWLKSEKDGLFLRHSLIPFFWKNIAVKCVERRHVE